MKIYLSNAMVIVQDENGTALHNGSGKIELAAGDAMDAAINYCAAFGTRIARVVDDGTDIDSVPSNIAKHLVGPCPSLGGMGELAAVSDAVGHYGNPYKTATIYWHTTPPAPDVVKWWVEEAGGRCININCVLWEDDGTEDYSEWCRWDVSYTEPSL